MNIKVIIEQVEESYVIKVFGEVDAYTVKVLQKKFAELEDIKGNHFVIDLAGVDYIDSTGLGVFIGFYKELNAQNGTLKIIGLNARLNRLFEITGLNKVMEIERVGDI